MELVDTLVQVAEQKENPLVAALSNRKVNTERILLVLFSRNLNYHIYAKLLF